ncbi:MAG: oxidoreductase, partial [Cyanobacteria bacterium]|nr:oxidoreductase [Cyanobacteriota bacterium]
AAIDGGWSGGVNVVNDEPIRIRDLVQQSLERQNLAPVRWSGEPTQHTNGRRIRNNRLKALGYRLLHPTVNGQSGVLPVSQVP